MCTGGACILGFWRSVIQVLVGFSIHVLVSVCFIQILVRLGFIHGGVMLCIIHRVVVCNIQGWG